MRARRQPGVCQRYRPQVRIGAERFSAQSGVSLSTCPVAEPRLGGGVHSRSDATGAT
jgi:hypothetical protein